MDALLVLTSSEDLYIEKILADIYARPHCNDFIEDKAFLLYLSTMVNQLVEIQPNYHIRSGHMYCDFEQVTL